MAAREIPALILSKMHSIFKTYKPHYKEGHYCYQQE